MRTIGQIKSVIQRKLHGTTLNKIGDFNTICRDAGELVLARIDPQETARKANLPNPVYDQVYEYAIPTDFKSPIDLYPQNRQNNQDTMPSLSRTFSKQFKNRRLNNQFAILWRDTVQFMKFSRYLTTPAVVDRCDSLTNNGTLTVGGNGSDLEIDTLNYISGTGSAKCAVSNAGSVVSVTLQIGENSSNYYSKTVTTGHFSAFTDGWNLTGFNLASATLTGTVDMSSINWWRITVTYNTNQTVYMERTLSTALDLSGNYLSDGSVFAYLSFTSVTSLTFLRIDSVTANIGSLFVMDYYSNKLFRNTAGTWLEAPTSDNDIINLSTDSYKIFEAELCRMITQEVQGAMGIFDFAYWELLLEGNEDKEGLYDQYLNKYPSERFDAVADYYNYAGDLDDGPYGPVEGYPQSFFN